MFDRLKQYLRRSDALEDERLRRIFGTRLRDKRLWSLNRHGIATGTAVGLFCAFLPMPMQMLPATIGAIALRGNLPVAIGAVWLSNPVTMVPIFAASYRMGRHILGSNWTPTSEFDFSRLGELLQFDGFRNLTINLQDVFAIYFTAWVGSLFFGALAACLGYFIVLYSWRLHVISRWRARREARRARVKDQS